MNTIADIFNPFNPNTNERENFNILEAYHYYHSDDRERFLREYNPGYMHLDQPTGSDMDDFCKVHYIEPEWLNDDGKLRPEF